MSTGNFHFTFTPVQSFVQQARRTRDLWAGSYLLSVLAANAMVAVGEDAVLFPVVRDNLLVRMVRGESVESGPDMMIGSLPNRFSARVKDPVQAGEKAGQALQRAWFRVCDGVRELLQKYCGDLLTGETYQIWKQQVENFWEISWVGEEEYAPVNWRKNWRGFPTACEKGTKCTICGERRALAAGVEDDRARTREFWIKLSHSLNRLGRLFREEGLERLCAVCTVKRLYPLIGERTLGWKIFYTSFPSTASMAARDWLREVSEKSGIPEVRKAVEKLTSEAKKSDVPQDELPLPGIGGRGLPMEFFKFNGDLFFQDAIDNTEFPVRDGSRRKELKKRLSELQQAVGSRARPFYALLAMDGDNMGKLLGKHSGRAEEISALLTDFSRQVRQIVAKHDGWVVYAGGDDVLALLPLSRVLRCAGELREEYVRRLVRGLNDERATISAGIVFAHMTVPLQVVVAEAHRILDEIAKGKVNRDAFAVRVWKRGGPVLTYARPWESSGQKWVDVCLELQEKIAGGSFSSGFLYRASSLFELLEPESGVALSDDEQVKLLVAEYLGNRELKWPQGMTDEQKRERATLLVRQLLSFSRNEVWYEGEVKEVKTGGLQVGGPLLLRFLADRRSEL